MNIKLNLQSQSLIVSVAFASSLSLQQVQASDPVFSIHSSDLLLNVSIAPLQVPTSVALGCGRLEGSQFVLISSSHLSNVSVRLVSWSAPLLNRPLHDRFEALPPPFSIILLTTGPKSPFFPCLPPKFKTTIIFC